jgi:hypothetical protein
MELPNHTCVNCAYLCVDADEYIRIGTRRRAIDNEKWQNLAAGVGYPNLVCYKGKLEDFLETNKEIEQIRNEIISPNNCRHWVKFINGMSPVATEQRESSKWAKLGFVIALITLATVLATWAVSQFFFE